VVDFPKIRAARTDAEVHLRLDEVNHSSPAAAPGRAACGGGYRFPFFDGSVGVETRSDPVLKNGRS
jgi:hypothetical protein